MEAAREQFSSRLTTVLTMVGVAVGLGNVWRFPYMMGQHGGSAFLVLYLGFVAVFAVPAVTAEWALGRHTRRGPMGAFEQALGPRGRWIGYLLVATVLIANSYYLVIVANVAYSAGFGLVRGFTPDVLPNFAAGLASGPVQVAIGLLIAGAAALVLGRGLVGGIERMSKLFVPLFGAVMVVLIILVLRLPGAPAALSAYMAPDFSQLTATSVFAALGQAFFSLSLGGTFYLIYGSYLRDGQRIPRAAVATGLGDAGAAVLAALFVVPAVLALGGDMQAGPLLIFETLPAAFGELPAGRWMGTAFLLGLWMMAFLSSLAAFQVGVAALTDRFGWRRGRASVVVVGAVAALMVPWALEPGLIGTLDLVFGSGMQVVGSGLTIAALLWGCGRLVAAEQIFAGRQDGWRGSYLWWLRWAVPAVLVVVLVLYVVDSVG